MAKCIKSEKKLVSILLVCILLLFIAGCTQTTGYAIKSLSSESSEEVIPPCIPEIECSEWSECNSLGTQTKTCVIGRNCGKTTTSIEAQTCIPCAPNWECSDWSSCSFGSQSRTCRDTNNCGTLADIPKQIQSCSCTPDWQCDEWTECNEFGLQTRICSDHNFCGTLSGMPEMVRTCTAPQSQDIDPTTISRDSALRICNQKAEECSEGIPAIAAEFRSVCWEIYYYTGDPIEILDFANGLC